jgi:hypothetical protein
MPTLISHVEFRRPSFESGTATMALKGASFEFESPTIAFKGAIFGLRSESFEFGSVTFELEGEQGRKVSTPLLALSKKINLANPSFPSRAWKRGIGGSAS